MTFYYELPADESGSWFQITGDQYLELKDRGLVKEVQTKDYEEFTLVTLGWA